MKGRSAERMARIRTVKPEFFLHEELYDLEQESGLPVRLAYAGLWTQADREGRFQWRPRTLKAQILPHDELDFSGVLEALAARGFVVKYTVDGETFGWIPTFKSHQVINNRESESDLPPPDLSALPDDTSTRAPRVPHACPTRGRDAQGEGKGREGKGKEQGREGENAAVAAPPLPERLDVPEFKEAWGKWVKHRSEIKKPLKPTMVSEQIDQFAQWGVERSVTAIKYTIGKGWQGIREPDAQQPAGFARQAAPDI
jgi:hypothetical protein